MTELKPCPKCKKPAYTDAVNCGHIWGYGIGCSNIFCENSGSIAIIKYAFSKEKAKKKAEKAWNRMVNDDKR